ncbi:iron-sulfur cluster repair di-iron protein [Spirosoma gilvum]
MKATLDKNTNAITVGEIVADDIRAAEVFKRLGIDFCCNGKQTLAAACQKAEVSVETVLEKLNELGQESSANPLHYTYWNPDFLADYIVNVHHEYLYNNLPFIEELVWKVSTKHGQRNPTLLVVRQLFDELKAELLAHLQKEERALFPYIKHLWATTNEPQENTNQSMSIKKPVECMEHEHDDAGRLLFQLREFTNDYTPPADACNSHRLMLSKLAELEADLMHHIHLENNILFPKALALEGRFN